MIRMPSTTCKSWRRSVTKTSRIRTPRSPHRLTLSSSGLRRLVWIIIRKHYITHRGISSKALTPPAASLMGNTSLMSPEEVAWRTSFSSSRSRPSGAWASRLNRSIQVSIPSIFISSWPPKLISPRTAHSSERQMMMWLIGWRGNRRGRRHKSCSKLHPNLNRRSDKRRITATTLMWAP